MDSDCKNGVNGRCFPFEGLIGPGGCSYDECFTDSQCPSGATCLCRGSSTANIANVCVPAGNCTVDSDCGPGGYCSPSPDNCYTPSSYYCHTALDACTNDSDCQLVDAGSCCCEQVATCTYSVQAQRWQCTQKSCCPP